MHTGSSLLEMCGIEKRFGALRANRFVDLRLGHGEVLGLLGENGAGKTTLMNILFGLYSADAGSVVIDGSPATIDSPADALAYGVGMVHQHFHLVAPHSVLENLMVGRAGRHGMLDRGAARARLEDIGRRYGLVLDPEQLVAALSVGEQQRLEIIKALFRQARILVLDEPTSVLTPQQAEGLFTAVRSMAQDGVGVIFISHKLREVLAITDRMMVMRRGQVVADEVNDGRLGPRQLAELMCGRELHPPVKPPAARGRVLLRLAGVTVPGGRGRPDRLKGVTLEVHAGEIVGLAGVSGNGQRELAEVIVGVRPASVGRIEVDGAGVDRPSPRRMRERGIAHIPEDRIGAGMIASLPLGDSMILPRVRQRPFSRFGWLNRAASRRFVDEQIRRFDIRGAGPGVRTGNLSGGNMQKALLARELACDPLVLVAAQPTRGLDVAAVEFVHRQFVEQRARGSAVLLISDDLEELFEVSDRILVMYEGRIVGDLQTARATVAEVGLLMAGDTGDAA